MAKWKIKKSKVDDDTYILEHRTSTIFTINWFQKVKIVYEDGINLYDKDNLSTYYSIESLPEYIINQLKNLPKYEV